MSSDALRHALRTLRHSGMQAFAVITSTEVAEPTGGVRAVRGGSAGLRPSAYEEAAIVRFAASW